MKTHKLLFISFAAVLVFNACKKNDDSAATPTSTSSGGNSICFKAVGNTYNLTHVNCSGNSSITDGIKIIQVYSYRVNADPKVWISVIFPKKATVGTHALSYVGGASYYTVEYNPADSGFYNAGDHTPGNIIITKNDTNARLVTGTFQATVTNDSGATRAITSGSFTATY